MEIVYSPKQGGKNIAPTMVNGKAFPSFDKPERAASILSALRKGDLGPVVNPSIFDMELIRDVHDAGMIEYLETAYLTQKQITGGSTPVIPFDFPPRGQEHLPGSFEGKKGYFCTDRGTPVGPSTWQAALFSTFSALTGARKLLDGTDLVYALCRPSGHHAGKDFFGGYCYLNNAALAANFLGKSGKKIAILDLDYHHGNGTQHIFYDDPFVAYGSLHIDPNFDYPHYAGFIDETGAGAGVGSNWNFPLPPKTNEHEYLVTLEQLAQLASDFSPGFLVLSAGFDTYEKDPLGTFTLSTPSYQKIGQMIKGLHLPTLIVQEGGYYVPDLGMNVLALLHGFMT